MGGKTGTTTSRVTIPPEILARYNSVNARAEQVAQTPFQNYSTDPNAFVAPLTSTQQAGIANTNSAAGIAQPYFGAATQAYGQGLGAALPFTLAGGQSVDPSNLDGNAINKYLSPYLGTVLGTTMAAQNQQNAQQRSAMQGDAISAGAFGGDRAGVGQANLAYQQNLSNNQTIANILNQGYGQALSTAQQQQGVGLSADQANRAALAGTGQSLYNQFTGYGQGLAGLGTGAQQAALQGAGAQIAAGQTEQQTQQAGLSALYNQFLQEKSYPFQTAQFLANIAMGTGALSGSTTSTTQPAPFFSDERLKENIEPIGETYDGQKIIKFNYKGQKQKQIGLTAQDVERHHPEAVGQSHGFKTVDYDAATEESARRAPRYAGGLAPVVHLDEYRAARAGGGLVGENDLQKLLASHQQMYASLPWAVGGTYGSAPNAQPRGGSSGIVPAASLHVAPLVTAKAPAGGQQQSGMSQIMGAVNTIGDLGKVADMGGKAYNWITGKKPDEDLPLPPPREPGMAYGGEVDDEDSPEGIYKPAAGLNIPQKTAQQKLQAPAAPGAPPQGGGLGSAISGVAGLVNAGSTIGNGLSYLLPFLGLKSGGSVDARHGYADGGDPEDPSSYPLPPVPPITFIGDSLAEQARHSARNVDAANSSTAVGLSPRRVLENVRALPEDMRGRNVVLSSGASNNPADTDMAAEQIAELKRRGANVALMGVGSRPDLAPLNDRLSTTAQDTGAHFTGPIRAGRDQVHAGSLGQLREQIGGVMPTEGGLGVAAPISRRPRSDVDPATARDYGIRTMMAEAGGEGELGQAAVAHVIRNRVNSGRWGDNAQDVVLAPRQFSPWNLTDGNDPRRFKPDSPEYQRAARIWDDVHGGAIEDPTGGALHFANVGASTASWPRQALARGPDTYTTIGGHTFFRGLDEGAPSRASAVAQDAPAGLAPRNAPSVPASEMGLGAAAPTDAVISTTAAEPTPTDRQGGYGNTRVTQRESREPNWIDRNRDWLLPALGFIGSAASSNSRYLGAALLQGAAGAAAGMTKASELEQAQQGRDTAAAAQNTGAVNSGLEQQRIQHLISQGAIQSMKFGFVPVIKNGRYIAMPADQFNQAVRRGEPLQIAPEGIPNAPVPGGATPGAGATPPDPAAAATTAVEPPPGGTGQASTSAATIPGPAPVTVAPNIPLWRGLTPDVAERAVKAAQGAIATGQWQADAPPTPVENPFDDIETRRVASNTSQTNRISQMGALAEAAATGGQGPFGANVAKPLLDVVNSMIGFYGGTKADQFDPAKYGAMTEAQKLSTLMAANNQIANQSRAWQEMAAFMAATPNPAQDVNGMRRVMAGVMTEMQRAKDLGDFAQNWRDTVFDSTGNPRIYKYTGNGLESTFHQRYADHYEKEKNALIDLMAAGARVPDAAAPNGSRMEPLATFIAKNGINDSLREKLTKAYGPEILRYFGVPANGR